MFVTHQCFEDYEEQEGTLIFEWMLAENGLSLEERWEILTE